MLLRGAARNEENLRSFAQFDSVLNRMYVRSGPNLFYHQASKAMSDKDERSMVLRPFRQDVELYMSSYRPYGTSSVAVPSRLETIFHDLLECSNQWF